MAFGIDIYRKFQTVTDWNAVKQRGVSFVYTKVTDGGAIASAGPADAIVNGARSVGIPVGGYHYAQFSPTPERQAEIFVAEVRRLGATGLVPMLDLEAPFGPNMAARDFGIRFCRAVAALGFRPGVYLNNAFAKAVRPDQWGIPGLAIWIARYGAKPDAAAGRYDIHQFSSTGSVPGIRAGSVDLNESYSDAHLNATPNTGGFLMALSNDDQDMLFKKVKDIDTTLGAIYAATGGKMTFGPYVLELGRKIDYLYSVLANTPDLNADGKQGDVSLLNWRQWQADQEKRQTAALDEIRAQLAALVAKLGGTQ